jgi:hypothetical protein
MPTYRFNAKEAVPVVEMVGGALNGAPPHLAVAACLMMAYAMVNGAAVPTAKVGKFVEDFSALLGAWDMEAQS